MDEYTNRKEKKRINTAGTKANTWKLSSNERRGKRNR
jgi:hypothetical protein